MSLDSQKVRFLCEQFIIWAMKCDEMKKMAFESTGEVREAYALIYKDFLWKLQSKAGQLWFYAVSYTHLRAHETLS
jgi:hypothetical protein